MEWYRVVAVQWNGNMVTVLWNGNVVAVPWNGNRVLTGADVGLRPDDTPAAQPGIYYMQNLPSVVNVAMELWYRCYTMARYGLATYATGRGSTLWPERFVNDGLLHRKSSEL